MFAVREPPLAPVAVAAIDDAALALARRLLRLPDAALASLRGSCAKDTILVLGSAEALPWVDGAIYLGRDPLAPALLMPTTLAPSIAPALLERAFALKVRPADRPLAILPELDPPRMITAGSALPISRKTLTAWLEQPR